MRRNIEQDPYLNLDKEIKYWAERGIWPCKWVCCPDAGNPPFVTAYRKFFKLDRKETIRVHVSADERYELFLDGARVGRGSERGDKNNWFYETYEFGVESGKHVLVARVWSLGQAAPYAQMSVYPGFILAAEGTYLELLGTGIAEWEAKKLNGYEFVMQDLAWGTGANLVIEACDFPWGFEKGKGKGWNPVTVLHEGANGFKRNEYPSIHLMKPASLPAMTAEKHLLGKVRFVGGADSPNTSPVPITATENLKFELKQWQDMLDGKRPFIVCAHTMRRVIIDLENYYCVYPELMVSGGKMSQIRVFWAESLYRGTDDWHKDNRNKIEGKYFRGVGDIFKPDGRPLRAFETLWWRAGRYVEIFVQTADSSLTIKSLEFIETRYPLEMESSFASNDRKLNAAIPIMLRGLQMCSHETYIDCPYYEQLMYMGDARLESLATYVLTRDDRLPRKALYMFDVSRINSGLTQSRYPSRVTQIIPPFSLWWVGMVHDFSLWRDDLAFVKSLMPGVRTVIDSFLSFLNTTGLVEAPNGWNFMDWVPDWSRGIPPDGEFGVSGIINWQFVLALRLTAELEEYVGEPELAARARRISSELAKRVSAAFWDEKKGLFADNLSKTCFSEHSQCLAILSGKLDKDRFNKVGRSLIRAKNISRTTIYFMHYLFEAYRLSGFEEELFNRLNLWFNLEKLGFKTTPEEPEPSRSDCHGWGSHPLYHYFATIVGIRPAAMGFRKVSITPYLGHLKKVKAKSVHPKGEIEVFLSIQKGVLNGFITLPKGLNGIFSYRGKNITLREGKQEICTECIFPKC